MKEIIINFEQCWEIQTFLRDKCEEYGLNFNTRNPNDEEVLTSNEFPMVIYNVGKFKRKHGDGLSKTKMDEIKDKIVQEIYNYIGLKNETNRN